MSKREAYVYEAHGCFWVDFKMYKGDIKKWIKKCYSGSIPELAEELRLANKLTYKNIELLTKCCLPIRLNELIEQFKLIDNLTDDVKTMINEITEKYGLRFFY